MVTEALLGNLNWSKKVLLACQLQERGNDFFTLRYIQRSTYTYLFSAKPISRLYSKVSCALRIVEKPPCDHGVFLGVIEVSKSQQLCCQEIAGGLPDGPEFSHHITVSLTSAIHSKWGKGLQYNGVNLC